MTTYERSCAAFPHGFFVDHQEAFSSRREAAVIIESFRKHYNQHRPHSGLGYLTPAEKLRHYKQAKTH